MRLLPSLTIGLSLLLLAACGSREPAATEGATGGGGIARADGLEQLGAAPSWKLIRIDGTPMSSDELKGKVVVVDFWATWCPPCIKEVPGYVAMQEKYADRGLVIVGISLDQQGPPVVQKFAERHRINYPLVMGDQTVVDAFGGVEGIPTTFLIDRNGQIRHRKVGAMEREDYEPLIAALL
jgi:peroxiredoxin